LTMRQPKLSPPQELSIDPTIKDIQRFLSRIEEVHGHWLWKGRTDENGYGRFDYAGTNLGAHRFSYALFKGVVPANRHVHHDKCRYHSCVHPCCLKNLTIRKNSQDG